MYRISASTVVLMLTAFLVTEGVSAPGFQGPGDLEGDAGRGATLFVEYTCYGCHGYTGETGSGTRLNPPRLNQAGFIGYLRNPPNPNQMPPYQQAEATDQNLADIYAFISSLESNSPEVDDIPLLEEILGEVE